MGDLPSLESIEYDAFRIDLIGKSVVSLKFDCFRLELRDLLWSRDFRVYFCP